MEKKEEASVSAPLLHPTDAPVFRTIMISGTQSTQERPVKGVASILIYFIISPFAPRLSRKHDIKRISKEVCHEANTSL